MSSQSLAGPAQVAKTNIRSIKQSLQEYARGIAGGLLVSLPLLYTMEMWWVGFIAHPWRLIVYILVTFGLLLGYNRYAGLRYDANMLEVVIDSVEEMGIGVLLAAVVLWLLGRISLETPISELIGQVVAEAMTVAIGVSVGTAQLGGEDPDDSGVGEQGQQPPRFFEQLVIALCGAVLFAANVAPTEEIIMIAVESSPWKLIALAIASLALGALILFASDFRGARDVVRGDWHSIMIGMVVTYAVALLTSALILLFFGRFDGMSLALCLAQTVVLAGAATLGASAGRLLLQ